MSKQEQATLNAELATFSSLVYTRAQKPVTLFVADEYPVDDEWPTYVGAPVPQGTVNLRKKGQ